MTVGMTFTDYVVTDRGGIIENRYAVHAAVVVAASPNSSAYAISPQLLYSVGDPSRLTLARSAAKPAQALAILETGAAERFNFSDADLALMCASHSSEERHLQRARAMLAKSGAREADLRCGGHPPLSEVVARNWIKKDFVPDAVCNNCSGKHAGMLAGTKIMGAELSSYHLPGNPMQLKVKEVFEQLCGLDEEESLPWGIDGCNLPAPAASLHHLAGVYAKFARAADIDAAGHQVREVYMGRIFGSMTAYPELVGGESRFCTDLMTAYNGQLVGKLGADGCYGIGIRASEDTERLGAEGAVGIAIKIEDGNINILYSAVLEILSQLQIGSSAVRKQLSRYYRPDVLNTVGVVTGHVSHLFEVKPVLSQDVGA
jgi:L-asparaginase II